MADDDVTIKIQSRYDDEVHMTKPLRDHDQSDDPGVEYDEGGG